MSSKSSLNEPKDPAPRPFETEEFVLPEYVGEQNRFWSVVDLPSSVAHLVDPSSATETLYWRRNYLYSTELELAEGCVEVAVKQFSNQGPGRRLSRRLKGSKARRSWNGALALTKAAVPTPDPILLVESRDPGGPSFFVSRKLEDFVEARYYFRSLEAGHETLDYPAIDADELMALLGESIRRLHAGGIWHRDLSIGNLLLVPARGTSDGMTVYYIDLNRARTDRRLTVDRRIRDLCRLRIFGRSHQEIFLRSYWEGRMSGYGFKRWLYRCYFHGFLFKIWVKGVVRKPFKWLAGLLPRRAHAHIPAPPSGVSKRDRVVWDELSDQPHQHATRLERLSIRIGDAGSHAREAGAALVSMPRIWKRYRELEANLYSRPVVWSGTGIAIRPWPEDPDALLGALDELGVKRVLLRLQPWQGNHDDELALAQELHRRGFELAFSLPQNRALVRDRERWRSAVTEISELFSGLGHHYQIGQAVNRSKWGVWNHVEYLELAQDASAILRQNPKVELMGPAVIDYELFRTAGILNVPWEGVFFEILASLLYVDRRGAPENRQLGYDTVDKVLQVKAIAETAKSCGGRSWITEMNWPLWEGPHSPAGKTVSVDERSQADFLTRFYLLALGTGMAERVYWWQLVARGYGLTYGDPDGVLVRRPSFHALATLHDQLEGSVFLGPLKTNIPGRLYRFRRPKGETVVVGWTADASTMSVKLPGAVARIVNRDGNETGVPNGTEVSIDGSPRYFWLSPD